LRARFVGLVVRHPARVLLVAGLLALTAGGAGVVGTQLWAAYHFRAARASVEHCHSAEARQHLTVCLRVWPHDPAVLLLAARNARRLGAFSEAEQFLDEYQRAGGDADPLTLERALLRAERGEMDTVARYCHSLVERHDPASPLVLEALARGYLRSYRLEEAGMCLEIWQDQQPDDPQELFLRGQGYELRGRRPDAIASFRRAVELDPEHEPARLHLARLLVQSAQPGEALPHLEYLLRRSPDDPQVQVYLARCRDQLGQQAEAVRLLDGVLARSPDYAPALAARGSLALRDGDLTAAECWLRQAAALAPGDSDTHYHFWQCLQRAGKAEEAEKEHARLKHQLEDKKLFADLIARLQQSPHNPAVRYELGMIALRAGSGPEAVQWLEGALAEDAHYAPAHRALAAYYRESGQPARAERHRRLGEEAGDGKQAPATP
jgi:predicted Zn-dependent protease